MYGRPTNLCRKSLEFCTDPTNIMGIWSKNLYGLRRSDLLTYIRGSCGNQQRAFPDFRLVVTIRNLRCPSNISFRANSGSKAKSAPPSRLITRTALLPYLAPWMLDAIVELTLQPVRVSCRPPCSVRGTEQSGYLLLHKKNATSLIQTYRRPPSYPCCNFLGPRLPREGLRAGGRPTGSFRGVTA